MEPEKFKLSDILYAIVIPVILVILIFVLAVYVNVTGSYHVLGEGAIGVILTQGFAQMIVLGVPLVLGLLWNKWAGGAAGFIMGGIFYVASAGQYNAVFAAYQASTITIPITNSTLQGILNGTITSLSGTGYPVLPAWNFFGDISMLFYLVNAVIIGYMAGALNNRSTNFKRMLGAGLTSAIITAVIQVFLNYTISLPPARWMAQGLWTDTSLGIAGLYGFVLAFVPSIALGIIVPIIGKVMTWYGLQPKHQ
ncbi:hypothetical protein MUP38_03865 [Candidatus Bathyarchaeota archaeon]|nr:hypothetical protein [Candidatus Bathyarchaeota archaeon]